MTAVPAGPCGPARLSMDRLGRPVVAADTLPAAAYGLGWSVSSHRREQMDLLRRASHGRLAEVVGPAALASDVQQRRLNLADVAWRCWTVLPAAQRELLESFAAGVNDASRELAAAGYEDWTPTDSIAVAQRMFQALASDGAELRMVEVMRRTLPAEVVDFLLCGYDEFATDVDGRAARRDPPDVPVAALTRLLDEYGDAEPERLVVADQRPIGSNAWAVRRNGRAVLSNDTHLELTRPSLWYPATLVLPDATVAGVTVPGLPVLVVAATEHLAWGFTRLPGDVVDLREVDAEPLTARRERIAVRGAPDEVVEVQDSRWGPVVDELAGRPVAFRSTLTDPAALDFCVVGLYHARTAAEGVAVVTGAGLPPVNVVLADVAGHVAWTVGGRFPSRPSTGPRGLSPHRDWSWIAPGDLPRLLDPASGFVVSCNNGNSAAHRSGTGWNFFPGVRARRVADLLGRGEGGDEAGGLRLQLDVDALMYAFYRDLALRYLPAGDARPELRSLRAEIAGWTGTADRDERGLALLVTFRELLREELFAALTGACQRYDPKFTYCHHGHEGVLRRLLGALESGLVPRRWRTPRRFVVGQLLVARGMLAARHGHQRPVRWGEANVLARIPMTTRPGPERGHELSGDSDCVRVTRPDFGAAVRFVVDPGRLAAGLLSIPGSACARPPADQQYVTRWVEGLADPLPGMPDPPG